MADKIKIATSKSMLVFVHGYNSGFADAAMRTAQIAYDLKFPGMPFFYSWPSANRVRAYLPDEEAARLSESMFEALIDDLTSSLPVTDIYIVAHSMGTRVVSHALQHRVEKGKSGTQMRELLLAAPDINAELFRGVIAPKLAAMQGLRTTVYASSSDLALMASKVVHGFQRVGETTGGVFVVPGHRDGRRQLGIVLVAGARPLLRGRYAFSDRRHQVGRAQPGLDQAARPDLDRDGPQRLLEVPVGLDR